MQQRAKGIVLNYITMAFKLGVGLLYTPFMLSKIGDSEYGILSIANSFIVFLTILDCGFGQTLIRYQTKNLVQKNKDEQARIHGLFLKLYAIVSVIAFILGLAIMFVYPLICNDKMSADESALFRQVFFVLLVNCVLTFPLRIFSADLQVHERFSFFKGINLVLLVIRYIIMTLLLIYDFRVLSLAVVISVTSLVTQMCYMIYSFSKLSFNISFGEIAQELKKEILTFSFYILINLVVDFLYDNTDKLLLGAIKGTVTVTVYTLGVTFYSYFKQLSTSISGVYMPKIVSEYEKENDISVMSETFNKVGKMQLAVLFLVLNLFIIFGRQFLLLWVGEGYEEAYIVGLLIMVPAIVPLSQNVGHSILRAMNLHKYRSYMYITIAILNIVMTIPFSIKYGAIGAAIGTCIATIIGEIIYLNWFYISKIGLKIYDYWKVFIEITLVSFVMDLTMIKLSDIFVRTWNWAWLIIGCVTFGLVYAAFIIVMIKHKKIIISE